MKKVLLISYYFPPAGGGPAIRAAKFAKYLPQFNWEPIIFTVEEEYSTFSTNIDKELLDEIPREVKIVRTKSFDPIKFRKSFETREAKQSFLNKIYQKIKRGISKNFLVPDRYILWVVRNIRNALKVIRQENVHIIFTTSPPNSAHILGLILKLITKKSWITDFRDPWTGNPIFSYNPLRERIENFLERKILNHTDIVVSNTEDSGKELTKQYPYLNSNKIIVIPNGFDPTDFHSKQPKIHSSDFTGVLFTYIGSLNLTRLPGSFLVALRSLLKEELLNEDRIRFRFIGPIYGIEDVLRGNGLNKIIEVIPAVSNYRSIQLMLESDVLLNFLPSWYDKRVISSKIYNYAYSKKPILALIPEDSHEADFIRKNELGKIVSPDDVEAIKLVLLDFYQAKRNGKLKEIKKSESINRFDRKVLTGKLAEVMEELM